MNDDKLYTREEEIEYLASDLQAVAEDIQATEQGLAEFKAQQARLERVLAGLKAGTDTPADALRARMETLDHIHGVFDTLGLRGSGLKDAAQV